MLEPVTPYQPRDDGTKRIPLAPVSYNYRLELNSLFSDPTHDQVSEESELEGKRNYKVRETIVLAQQPGWEYLESFKPIRLTLDPLPGCGGHLWPSALLLTYYLSRPAILTDHAKRHSSALELGSGTGAVGIVLGRLWESLLDDAAPKAIAITDIDKLLPLMKENVGNNFWDSQIAFEVQELFWGTDLPDWLLSRTLPSLILLSDCIYLELAFPLLIQTLTALYTAARRTHGENVQVLMAAKKRRKADKRFWTMFRKKGWKWSEIEWASFGEGEDIKPSFEGARLFRCWME